MNNFGMESNPNRNRNTQQLLKLSLILIGISVIISWFFRYVWFISGACDAANNSRFNNVCYCFKSFQNSIFPVILVVFNRWPNTAYNVFPCSYSANIYN